MLFRYIEDFGRLNVNTSKGASRPYKPALLLAVMDGIEAGRIQNRQVYITPELIADFRVQLLNLGSIRPYQARNFAYPFYHLKSEEFWRLKEKPGKKIVLTAANSVSGLRPLAEAVDYAQLDVNLWALLIDKKNRRCLRNVLLGKYAAGESGEAE